MATQNLNGPLRNFLNNLNNDIIYSLPFENNANDLAIHIRNNTTIKLLTGKCILRWNVEREAQRLQINDQDIIYLATNMIWNSHLQRDQFTKLANDANDINRDFDQASFDTRNRMSLLGNQQISINNPFEHGLFNGTNF
ncbi:hypothetical protein C1645_816320 [Glomus cerebriforme]|uniref:Uncharacterized protein n=1 Tax=Glomus cerebriforme TaxID=658196 RepID=A0A397TL40_9GLOM|nr:hypothetical protein C1645_816320 [Glomus cerebriforme]